LTAQSTGEGYGTINYTFWWHCPFAVSTVQQGIQLCNDPANPAVGAKFDGISDLAKSVSFFNHHVHKLHNRTLLGQSRFGGRITTGGSRWLASRLSGRELGSIREWLVVDCFAGKRQREPERHRLLDGEYLVELAVDQRDDCGDQFPCEPGRRHRRTGGSLPSLSRRERVSGHHDGAVAFVLLVGRGRR
jgi:hypothetical protein